MQIHGMKPRSKWVQFSLLAGISFWLIQFHFQAQQREKTAERLPASALFRDRFEGKLADGWYWLREHKEAWRVSKTGLEVLIEPGNMWGPANDARNVLLRPAPILGSNG